MTLNLDSDKPYETVTIGRRGRSAGGFVGELEVESFSNNAASFESKDNFSSAMRRVKEVLLVESKKDLSSSELEKTFFLLMGYYVNVVTRETTNI